MSTFERLAALLAAELGADRARLVPGATLEDLEIDSLRMIEVAFAVEDEFGVIVGAEPAQLMARVKTLGDFADYVDELLAQRTGGAQEPAA
jgi:acyl carrier protein